MEDNALSEDDRLQPMTSEIARDRIPSVALARLIEEVRNDAGPSPHKYNRFHNRHNRS